MNGNTVIFERSEYEAMEVDEKEETIKMKTNFLLGRLVSIYELHQYWKQ